MLERLRRLPPVVAYLPFVVACGLVFWVSDQSIPPIPASLGFRASDKLLHASAYAVLATAALIGTRTHLPRPRAHLVAAVLAAAFGLSDELHQSAVPGRSADVIDALADAIGASLMMFVLARVGQDGSRP